MTAEHTLTSSEIRRRQQIVAVWLLACCVLVYAMVVLGGVTRLTGSGLSIVEWRPVTGVIPPMSEAAWWVEFEKYRASPEYLHVNRGMSLIEFKFIYWYEYAHRLLGRLLGLVFALPLIWFAWKRWVRGRTLAHLGGVLVLGGVQGALGWYMVASGLVDEPRVSQYRLTAHLLLAIVIYAWMLILALSMLMPARGDPPAATPGADRRGGLTGAFGVLVFIMIASGGMMAGTHAGFSFNTFPLMNGDLIPPGLVALDPLVRNLSENVVTIQFVHRWLAMAVLALGLVLWLMLWRKASARAARTVGHVALAVLLLQVGLGIATLLGQVPLVLAAAHQAGALLLLSCVIVLMCLRRASFPALASGRPEASHAAVSSPVGAGL